MLLRVLQAGFVLKGWMTSGNPARLELPSPVRDKTRSLGGIMSKIHPSIVFFAASCLCMAAASAEQLYKWVDDQGHTHYTQTPPPSAGTRAKSVNIEVARADATAAAAAAAQQGKDQDTGKDQTTQHDTRDIDKEAAIREKVDADEASQRQKDAQLRYCQGLQSQLSSAEHANDNLSQSQRGARKLMDDAAQQKKVDDIKTQIRQQC